ncbi:UDP-N-acetylmuramoylalanyl-D-glutamate--2,6-diaminopimelate ligase MurE [Helicobacter bizzozeronii]|uniref:UDP-N-acetylmuramoyl-L-alanyl-D-glutamate--2, 6-diaminopimelate ligase n=1 Tax=Helicobacter bizzozeronii TaxID=56877 RepID=UPI00244D9748|nr:UDP-N-acetylmuramoyl-L-alanyl-D-glutamate--2,6-diaminopimelate ligase [Helicobacter bizzozeronii]GMB92798.1 UDP-N-acetylmuramoylalanyl-D-glutamate--2,6-diaminopimelate ligase MurE [Helicobacter bizzozeronii]
MKLAKRIEVLGRVFDFISDDTRDLGDPHCLLLKTPSNQAFVQAHLEKFPNTPYIHASELKNHFDLGLKIIGITGTNGKTTTASLIYSLLLDLGYGCALLGTRGFFCNDRRLKPKGLTTPPLLELYSDIERAKQEGASYFVMEVSSHAIAQERILGLEFSAKVITNITSDHLDYHKDLDTYRQVKNAFLQDTGLKIINRDDPHVRFNPTNAYGYGIEAKSHLSVSAYSLLPSLSAHVEFWENPSLRYRSPKKSTHEACLLHSPLMGLHNLYNLLGGLLCVKLLTKQSLESLSTLAQNFLGVQGRMEVVHSQPLVIVDFAHTADGFEQIFNSFKGHKIKALFGAGGNRDKSKRPLMGAIASQHAMQIYITSDNPRYEDPLTIMQEILAGVPKHKHAQVILEVDRKKAIILALEALKSDEVLLILGKGDESVQIIGDQNLPFDDREVVKTYYEERT